MGTAARQATGAGQGPAGDQPPVPARARPERVAGVDATRAIVIDYNKNVMSDQPFKIDVSQRISRLPPYLFGRINKMKYDKRVAGVDIIDLGMGNPTDPTPECVVQKLAEAARDPRNHRYSVSTGILGLRREVAKKYKSKYGVEL